MGTKTMNYECFHMKSQGNNYLPNGRSKRRCRKSARHWSWPWATFSDVTGALPMRKCVFLIQFDCRFDHENYIKSGTSQLKRLRKTGFESIIGLLPRNQPKALQLFTFLLPNIWANDVTWLPLVLARPYMGVRGVLSGPYMKVTSD